MKSRQSKKGEYRRMTIQIPVTLWVKIEVASDDEHKSYSAFIVEILRLALKNKTQ